MDPKVSSPEDSSRVVAHENIYFSNGKYETRSLKLADENAKHWVVFEGYLWLVARLAELASKLENKTKLFQLVLLRVQERISHLALERSLLGKRCYCWVSLCWYDRRSLFNERVLLRFSITRGCSAAPPSFRLLPSTVSSSNCAQRFDYRALSSCRELGGAAEHLIDGSENAFGVWALNLKVPISSTFLFSCLILHITQWTSAKKKIDLDKMQSLLEVLKTFKLAAILVHHSHQSSLGLEWVVT